MRPQGEFDEAEVFDFLDEWTRDVECGRELPLAHYLRRYPGCEEAIAREYLARSRRSDESTGFAGAVATPLDAQERRIGPFRLLRELGRGGQGAVWLAEDTRIARQVALKFLPSSFALLSADRRRRLQREAEVVSRLQHPSICPVYEAQIEGETPYIAMRFVEGETLASAITRAKSAGAAPSELLPLPPRNATDLRRVLGFFERAARAVHAAHDAGVIHRDIKPGNVMVARDGEPVVLDFGQARDEHAALGEQSLSGEVVGTPAYMSPEQVAGSARAIDRRTDVWSLGASLYEALTLERAFDGRSVADLLLGIQTRVPRDARGLNPALDVDTAVVLETALEKDVQRRYASALDFAEDLRRVREYEPIHARPAGPLLRLWRWSQRHPALAASIAALFLSLSLGLAWTLHLLGRERTALEGERVALAHAQDALTHALGRHLAERAVDLLDEDSSASLVLGIQAVERAPNYQTREALMSALDACRLATLLDGDPAQRFLDLDVGADSRVVAAGLSDGTARIYALDDGRELLRIPAEACEVTHVRLDPRCERLVTASTDEFVRVWNARTGALEHSLAKPGAGAVWLEFARSGERLLELDGDGICTIWRTSDWSPIAQLRAPADAFACARFSPDGRWVLMSSVETLRAEFPRSPVALLWSVESASIVGGLFGHTDWITASAFGSSGSLVATASADGTARLWRIPSCEQVGLPLEHEQPLLCVCVSPDEGQLAVGSSAGEASSAYLWDLASRTRTELHGGHRDKIVSAEFSPDGGRLVTVSNEMVLHVWSTRGGRELMRSSAWIPPIRANWTPDGRRIVMLGNANTAPIWFGENPPDTYALVGHDAALYHARLAADGKRAVTAGADGTARLWSTPNWDEPRGEIAPGSQLAVLRRDDMHVTDAFFTPDSGRVITLSREGIVAFWDPTTAEVVHEERVDGAALTGEIGRGFDIGMGEMWQLAVVSSSGRAYVWQAGCLVTPFEVIDDAATCAHFSPDMRHLIVGRSDCSVRVYDSSRRTLVREHRWTTRGAPGVVDLAVRPDGGEIAVACRDDRIRYFQPLAADVPRRDTIAFPLQDISYDKSGKRLVATGPLRRGAIRLLNIATYTTKSFAFEVYHADNFTCARFSPDGSLLLTASRDGTVFVRRPEDGQPVVHLVGHRGAVVDASFSSDGGPLRVITASADGTARVWPVDPLEPAKARRPRELREWEGEREKRLALPLEYR